MTLSTHLPRRCPLAVSLLIVLSCGAALRSGTAQELRSVSPDDGSSSESACVLLRNGQVLFGTAEPQGDWVIVRNGQGNQVRLQRSKVVGWADSLRDLYQYRVDHRRSGDPQVHLKDARWCLRHGLLDLAASELRAVYQIVPDHPGAAIIERQIRSALGRSQPGDRSAEVSQVGYEDEVSDTVASDEPANDDPTLGLDTPSFQHFVRHVHPLLLNRCGGCHSHTSDLDWQLIVPSSRGRTSARITRENLRAIQPLVRFGDPEASELVHLALQPHGGGKAPLHTGDRKAIAALRDWIRHARSAMDDPDDVRPLDAGGTMALDAGGTMVGLPAELAAGVAPAAGPAVAPLETKKTDRISGEAMPGQANGRPSRLPAVDNPFDPELFNRRFHPP